MAKSKKSGKLKILTLLLSLVMLLSFGALALSACSQSDTDEDDTTSETRTDTQTFSNADFEYFSDNDGTYLIGSANSWTSSAVSNENGSSAPSSSAKSGIVNTQSRDSVFTTESWEEYVADPENGTFDWSGFYYAFSDHDYYDGLDEDDEDDAAILEDAEYFTDIDNYYDLPGWDLFEAYLESPAGIEQYGEDGEPASFTDPDTILNDRFRTQFINYIRAVNPGTHWTGSADEETLNEEKGTNVLMLHNYRTNGYGTAMRYASSTITLEPGTAASVSVWVKTYGLTYNKNTSVGQNNRGAFIEISNSVNGNEQAPLVVRNIDTQLQNPGGSNDPAENNGWVEYTFYLRASSYATTTFTVELGLGRQSAGNSNRYEYVQGYAFFDDLTYNVYKANDWDAVIDGTYTADLNGDGEEETTAAAPARQRVVLDSAALSDATIFNAKSLSENVFALDLDELNGKTAAFTLTDANTQIGATEDARGNTVESYFAPDTSLLNANDLTLSGITTAESIAANSNYAAAVRDGFEGFADLPFTDGGAAQVLLLYSGKGAPYTATVTDEQLFTVSKGETLLFSFWVKTSDLQGGTGATVTLIDGDNETAIGAVDTSTLTGVNIKDDYNKAEDIFGGWQLCAFYVSNEEDEPLTFSLEFSIGPTAITGTSLSDYVPGYAAFTGLRSYSMTQEQAALAQTGTYAVAASLTGERYTGQPSFDTPAVNDKTIETGIANPSNYTGVYGGSYHVGGTDANANNTKNSLASAGLLSKEYFADYAGNAAGDAWIDVLDPYFAADLTSALNASAWAEIFGNDCSQPLLIAKTVKDSYGFVANSAASAAASSYTQITVRVKLSPQTRAYVYLIDTEEPDITDAADADKRMYADTIGQTTGVSYRYDENGNLVNLDPDDDAFDRRANTLLYYQDNGLWAKERNYTGDELYANLSNYEKDTDGNLTDADGEIVYYLHDGAFYRYHDEDSDSYEVAVKDFTEAGVDLTGAQLQDKTEQALFQEIVNDTDEVSDWIYVRFFLAVGDEGKNYRLEFWSGDRSNENGSTLNGADGGNFAIFDVVQYSDLAEESFNSLIDAQTESLAKQLGYADSEALEDAYLADPAAFANGITANAAGETIENAGTLTYYHFSLYDDEDYAPFDASRTDGSDPYSAYDPSSYENTVAYLKYAFEDSGVTYLDTYVNYAASEITVATSTDDDTTEDDDTTTEPEYNVWLLVSSILLAAVLVITLIAVLLRKLLSGMKRKTVEKAAPAYSNTRDRYVRKLRKEEAEAEEDEEELFTDAELYNEAEEAPADENGEAEEAPADESGEAEGEDKTE